MLASVLIDRQNLKNDATWIKWRLGVFFFAQDRQESTELIDAEIDGEHEKENKYQEQSTHQ